MEEILEKIKKNTIADIQQRIDNYVKWIKANQDQIKELTKTNEDYQSKVKEDYLLLDMWKALDIKEINKKQMEVLTNDRR